MSAHAHMEVFRLWWPDYEANPRQTYDKLAKRSADVDHAMEFVTSTRTCVQAGGHVGLWPLRLAAKFQTVHTFEPDAACYEALIRNAPNVHAYNAALGATDGPARLRLHRRSGSAKVVTEPNERDEHVFMRTVDSLTLTDCDLICLDVEGSEIEALRGAVQTIAATSPVIYVEMLPGHRDALSAYLTSIGYEMRKRIHSDAIWTKVK
jgi:FkbM family methyltransferase